MPYTIPHSQWLLNTTDVKVQTMRTADFQVTSALPAPRNGAPGQLEVLAVCSSCACCAPQLPGRNKSLAAVIAGYFNISYLQGMIFFFFFLQLPLFFHLQSKILSPGN